MNDDYYRIVNAKYLYLGKLHFTSNEVIGENLKWAELSVSSKKCQKIKIKISYLDSYATETNFT